jgi:hypothetical protein
MGPLRPRLPGSRSGGLRGSRRPTGSRPVVGALGRRNQRAQGRGRDSVRPGSGPQGAPAVTRDRGGGDKGPQPMGCGPGTESGREDPRRWASAGQPSTPSSAQRGRRRGHNILATMGRRSNLGAIIAAEDTATAPSVPGWLPRRGAIRAAAPSPPSVPRRPRRHPCRGALAARVPSIHGRVAQAPILQEVPTTAR